MARFPVSAEKERQLIERMAALDIREEDIEEQEPGRDAPDDGETGVQGEKYQQAGVRKRTDTGGINSDKTA